MSLWPRNGDGRRYLVYETTYFLVPGYQPDRGALANRKIPETIQVITNVTTFDRVEFQIIATVGYTDLRLIGNDTDGARLAALTIESALRSGECLNPGDIVHVDIQDLVDRGYRLFVKVVAYTGHRSRVIAVATTGNTTHVDLAKTGTTRATLGSIGNGRHEMDKVFE